MKKWKDIKKGKSVFYVLGIIVSVILLFILIMNLTIVFKSYFNPDKIPSFLGVKLFIVETDSMKPVFDGGDLIVTKKVDPKTLEVGDVISFTEGRVVVTHRIENVEQKGDEIYFVTKGDANNSIDIHPISENNVESIYWFKIKRLGKFAMFMQTPSGMLVFIGIPLLGFIARDVLRYREKERIKNIKKEKEIQKLKDELKRREK